jgi:Amt family ammonium transporter
MTLFGGTGGVSIGSQLIVTGITLMYAFVIGALVYGVLKMTFGIRLSDHNEMLGSDLAIHHVETCPEEAL